MSERCIQGCPSVLPDHSLCCRVSAIQQSGNLGFDVVAELAEGLHLGHFFRLDFEAELLLDNDHDVYEIEAVDANVFLQTGFRLDFLFVNLKVLNEEFPDFCFYFLSVHVC